MGRPSAPGSEVATALGESQVADPGRASEEEVARQGRGEDDDQVDLAVVVAGVRPAVGAVVVEGGQIQVVVHLPQDLLHELRVAPELRGAGRRVVGRVPGGEVAPRRHGAAEGQAAEGHLIVEVADAAGTVRVEEGPGPRGHAGRLAPEAGEDHQGGDLREGGGGGRLGTGRGEGPGRVLGGDQGLGADVPRGGAGGLRRDRQDRRQEPESTRPPDRAGSDGQNHAAVARVRSSSWPSRTCSNRQNPSRSSVRRWSVSPGGLPGASTRSCRRRSSHRRHRGHRAVDGDRHGIGGYSSLTILRERVCSSTCSRYM